MRIPKDLQAAIGKKEIRYSLQEGSLRTAKGKAKMVAGQVTDLFRELRKENITMVALSRQQIDNPIAKYRFR